MRLLIRLFFKLTLSINIGLIRSFIDEHLLKYLKNVLSNNLQYYNDRNSYNY